MPLAEDDRDYFDESLYANGAKLPSLEERRERILSVLSTTVGALRRNVQGDRVTEVLGHGGLAEYPKGQGFGGAIGTGGVPIFISLYGDFVDIKLDVAELL